MKIVFTEHSKERMKKRSITEDEIIEAIKRPDNTKKQGGNIMPKKILAEPILKSFTKKDIV